MKLYIWPLHTIIALSYSFKYISPAIFCDAHVKSVKHTGIVIFDHNFNYPTLLNIAINYYVAEYYVLVHDGR